MSAPSQEASRIFLLETSRFQDEGDLNVKLSQSILNSFITVKVSRVIFIDSKGTVRILLLLKMSTCRRPSSSSALPLLERETLNRLFTRDDSQLRCLAQHSVATLLRHCFEWFQHCSNIATLCCAKNRRCESSRVTSPLC